jgi:hypothetical protein
MIPRVILAAAILLASCEPISFREYEMEPYSGAFTWERVTAKAAWSNRYDHAAIAFKGKIWIFGGYDSGRIRGDTYLEDVWNSPDGANWSLATDSAPWHGRRGHTVTLFDDGTGEAIYLVGGFEVNEQTGYRQYTNDCWKSTDGIQWTCIKPRTQPLFDSVEDFLPRFNHSCIATRLGGKNYLFLIGGSTMREGVEGGFSFLYLHDVWRSEDGIHWTKLDNTDFGQRCEQAVCVDPATGRMYMQGGTHGVTFDNEQQYDQPGKDYYNLWYSDDGVTWQAEESFSLNRAGHAMVMYRHSLWLMPGKEDNYRNLRYAEGDLFYTWQKPEGGPWVLDSRGSAFNGRHSYATVEFQDKIWILGGETADNGQNNDVWCGYIAE